MKVTKLLFIILFFILILPGCKKRSIEQLLDRGEIKAAEKRCEKMKPEEKSRCYKTIALFFLKKNQFKKAADYYARAGAHENVINSYFQGDLIREAEKYCTDQTGETKKQCAVRLGKKFFILENYNKAIQYYQLAGDQQKISYIKSRIPVFQLVERLNKKSREVTDPKVKEKIIAIKSALTGYIYMEKYHKWPYQKKTGPYQMAAGLYDEAQKMLEEKVVPTFINTLNNGNFDWSEKNVRTLSFERLKLENLAKIMQHLHHISQKREFFTKFSVIEQESKKDKKEETHRTINYEEAFKKVLEHTKMLLEEIVESNDVKDKGLQEDYQHDMAIDMKVIDYIASMMDNIKARIDDIYRRSRKLQKSNKDEKVKKTVEKVFWDFVVKCHRVFHLMGKGEYQEANTLLISSYQKAKNEIEFYAR